VADCCVGGNEFSGFVKCREFSDSLGSSLLRKKNLPISKE
jgi:hypothetical protein